MSDRTDHTSHEQLAATDLLDRVAALSPTTALEPEDVIALGRRKVRRRRGSALGLGALTLSGVLWAGAALVPSAPEESLLQPAVSWEEGRQVQLFDNEPHPSEVGRTHWSGELRSAEGDTAPELVLIQDGEQLEPIPAEDGPGDVLLYRTQDLVVAVWASPVGSSGEWPLWTPGMEAGQGGTFTVDGVELWYSSAEFVAGTEPGLQELYWFSADAAHAASGAPVLSTVVSTGDTRAVVMLDEERQVWGTSARATDAATGQVHVSELQAGAGYTGWVPGVAVSPDGGAAAPDERDADLAARASVIPTSLGILPPGAALSPTDSPTTAVAQGTIGAHVVVLAEDATRTMGTPPLRYTLGEREYNLQSWVETGARTLEVAGLEVHVSGTPDGLQLFVGPGEFALVPLEDLSGDRAVVVDARGGHLVVVPGWAPDAHQAALRVQVGGDAAGWVVPDAVHFGALFDGTPLTVIALDAGVLGEGETIQGVGIADGAAGVTPHELEDGVQLSDATL